MTQYDTRIIVEWEHGVPGSDVINYRNNRTEFYGIMPVPPKKDDEIWGSSPTHDFFIQRLQVNSVTIDPDGHTYQGTMTPVGEFDSRIYGIPEEINLNPKLTPYIRKRIQDRDKPYIDEKKIQRKSRY